MGRVDFQCQNIRMEVAFGLSAGGQLNISFFFFSFSLA
jgi:hypothetical protein